MPCYRASALVLAVIAAGCGPLEESDGDDLREMAGSGRKGLDYAWGRPSPKKIRAAGYTFAVRYLSYDKTGKNLSASEAKALRAAGVDVAVVWEQGAYDALSGSGLGVTHAKAAKSQAAACGSPAGRPIYFAVDFDATPGQQAAINAYFDGVASVIGHNRTGGYGGYYVIKRLFDAGKIKYGWQTYAWSGGQWDPRAQLRQIKNGIHVDGVDSDIDQAMANDFGQWGYKAPVNCQHRSGVFGWSCDGKISGMSCLQITEPADPDTWKDNYFCSARNFGFKWSHKGAIAGMRCTKVHESADPDTWNDNYLCVPEVSPFRFKWSSAGPIANMNCLKWDEPADKSTWNDNYLCWDRSALQKRGPFAWSSKGPVAGMTCTQIVEPADPDTWKDNYFCATSDLGMRWSSNGPIAGLRCTKIAEGADPHTWKDNYLCVPTSSPYTFRWSSAGPLDPHDCIAWYEPADPDTWDDNYLCW
jgi:hypothetical protein